VHILVMGQPIGWRSDLDSKSVSGARLPSGRRLTRTCYLVSRLCRARRKRHDLGSTIADGRRPRIRGGSDCVAYTV